MQVNVNLSPEEVKILLCVVGQYIFEDEHFVCRSSGEVLKHDNYESCWGCFPLAPILDKLRNFYYDYDTGDSLVILKEDL